MEVDPWVIAVVVVGAVGAIISGGTQIMTFIEKAEKLKKPHDDHVAMVQEHDKKLNNDFMLLEEIQAQLRISMQTDLLVLEHIISGNHVEKLKDQRDFIQRYLIEK